MRCGSCGFDNPEGMKFCGECATPLKSRCPQCGFENPPKFKFCGECATPLTGRLPTAASAALPASAPPASYTPKHLAERIRAEQTAMETRGEADGERKTITALFADIKGSMALMEDLDPEDARTIIDPALALMMEAVHRYEGYVAQSTGDGIFAFFGAPIAHEDHPQRALYAALRMQEESRRLAEQLRVERSLPSLQIRVGINTGEVVMRGVRKDDERQRREKVTGKVLTLDRNLEDTLPYLFALLGMAEPEVALQHMDPQIRKQRTFAAIKRLLLRESLDQPLIVILEDLHWLDGETQTFLSLFSESVATACVLLLVNYRPEYRHEWGSKTYYTQLRLDPLEPGDAHEFLTALVGDDPTLHSLKRFILEKSEGNPFFMEELVQALFEQGVVSGGAHDGGVPAVARSLTDLQLPATVQGVLASRIDRLPPEDKALLQTLAVIGKEFSLSLLKQVVERSEEELQTALFHLQAAEFIYEQPAFPEVEYTFKHALTQEVAYSSVLIERRKALHERTARAMAIMFHARLDDYYSDLAYHYSRSANTEKAVEYLGLAGHQAAQRSAHQEALSQLTTALELLRAWPETPERARQELSLQVAVGASLQLTKGFGAPEVEATYTRARELCRQVGETPQLFPVLLGLSRFYFARGQFQTARELDEQLLSLAQRLHDPGLLVSAYAAMGWSLCSRGDFVQARAYAEQGIALYDAQPPRAQVVRYGSDAKVLCLSLVCSALWSLSYPDQALQRSGEALGWAQELSHPISMSSALLLAAVVHQRRGQVQALRDRAEALIALATEHGFPLRIAEGTILQGWALVEQGQGETGLTLMRQGLIAYRATATEAFLPSHLARLAEAYGKVGQPEEGLTALAEALAMVDKRGQRLYEAELYQLKGKLRLQTQIQGVKAAIEEEAEECFHKAIEVARMQQAKSLELRATTSLARLWQQQGKQQEAHSMLSKIYGWFTEGFDTKDLQEAKTLLEELGR